jgi:ATP-binding cassette subfamily B protein
MAFPFYRQLNVMDCGPTCLRMVSKYYGKHYSADTLRQKAGYSKQGVSLLGISETAERIGFRTRGLQISFEKLLAAPLPAILHWDQNHFVVLVSAGKKQIRIADPGEGIVTYDKQEFLHFWLSNGSAEKGATGTLLLLEPTSDFYKNEGEEQQKLGWGIILQYFRQTRPQLISISVSIIVGSILQLIFPFLTQSIVDTGINTHNLSFITVILCAQLMLTFSTTVIGFIRSRLQLRVSNVINISILSDFWIKLTRLPLSYFDLHQTGDTLQRLEDNKQVQSFLTGQTLTTVFSLFSFVVYAAVLVLYSVQLFLVFLVGNLAYFGWIRIFMGIRRKINYETFRLSSKENNSTLELIQGMQEIRLNNAEKQKRWRWENIQANVFRLNFRSLNFSQWQSAGGLFISQTKDIVITYMVAQMVVKGELTLGTMLAIQYIIGQLNSPVSQFISLSQNLQDAKISMERLNEIHELSSEEPDNKVFSQLLPADKSLYFKDLSFSYPGAGNEPVLRNINLEIPQQQVTAIVGTSGSGKTTLLKILLRIYDRYHGELKVGDTHLKQISHSFWRSRCGAVLQDGYIFNDTIANNIAVGDDHIDQDRLIQSCSIANLLSFIESLPNGLNTRLGAEGIGISQGQRQRLLIARAVYKQPQFLFFDEATNALDANNEKAIVRQLDHFFKDRTVIVVAHRLSTVRNADKIVVLHEGRIVEEGTHQELTELQGHYYELVKNQLELGS